jgi:cation transport regulator ChaB
MRKTTGGQPNKSALPDTIARSDSKAQRTWAKAHDNAVEQYGEGQRAHRTAYAALKHSYQKKGDRWVPKDGKGPSDPRARHPQARRGKARPTAESTFTAAARRSRTSAPGSLE